MAHLVLNSNMLAKPPLLPGGKAWAATKGAEHNKNVGHHPQRLTQQMDLSRLNRWSCSLGDKGMYFNKVPLKCYKEKTKASGRSQNLEAPQSMYYVNFVLTAWWMHNSVLSEQGWPDIFKPGLGVLLSLCHFLYLHFFSIWTTQNLGTAFLKHNQASGAWYPDEKIMCSLISSSLFMELVSSVV